jgi:hypothetical protein
MAQNSITNLNLIHMRNILTLLTIIAILGLSSCKKDKDSDDPAYCSADWVEELEVEYDALYDAYIAYAADMSVENCNAYKEAYLDYIDGLEPFLECNSWTVDERQEIQDAIDEAEAAMSELNCE